MVRMDEYPVHARWAILAAIGAAVGMAWPLPYFWQIGGWTLAVICGVTLVLELGEWFMRQSSRHYRDYRRSQAVTKETEYVNALATLSEARFDFLAKRNLLAELEVGYGPRVTWVLEGVRMPLEFAKQWHGFWQMRGGDKVLPADRDWDNEPHRDQMRAYNQHLRAVLKKEGFIDNPAGPLPARFLVNPDEALAKVGFWQVMALMELVEPEEYGNGLDSVQNPVYSIQNPVSSVQNTVKRPPGGWTAIRRRKTSGTRGVQNTPR